MDCSRVKPLEPRVTQSVGQSGWTFPGDIARASLDRGDDSRAFSLFSCRGMSRPDGGRVALYQSLV
jgi:hypothetical protein